MPIFFSNFIFSPLLKLMADTKKLSPLIKKIVLVKTFLLDLKNWISEKGIATDTVEKTLGFGVTKVKDHWKNRDFKSPFDFINYVQGFSLVCAVRCTHIHFKNYECLLSFDT